MAAARWHRTVSAGERQRHSSVRRRGAPTSAALLGVARRRCGVVKRPDGGRGCARNSAPMRRPSAMMGVVSHVARLKVATVGCGAWSQGQGGHVARLRGRISVAAVAGRVRRPALGREGGRARLFRPICACSCALLHRPGMQCENVFVRRCDCVLAYIMCVSCSPNSGLHVGVRGMSVRGRRKISFRPPMIARNFTSRLQILASAGDLAGE